MKKLKLEVLEKKSSHMLLPFEELNNVYFGHYLCKYYFNGFILSAIMICNIFKYYI